jgi:glycerol dehydrogenase
MSTLTARAFGAPFRYVQGPAEFSKLRDHLNPYPGPVLVLVDGFLFDKVQADLAQDFAGTGISCQVVSFGGECSESEVARITALVRCSAARVVVGVGGGKTLDTAKLVAAAVNAAAIMVPTSASTDAPVSSMAVLYRETGEHLRSVQLPHAPELILVDSEIIAKAPVRLFVAGIGDALSTWFEARANELSDTANYIGAGYRRSKAGMGIAKACFDILMEEGLAAKLALEQGMLNEAVENVIEANTLLSGLGFENTGCAGAHALHTGLSEIPSAHACYHGERVAFGVLFQLVLEHAPHHELESIQHFCHSLGLPLTLRQLNVDPTPENIRTITARVLDGNSGIEAEPFPLAETAVYNAITTADTLGAAFLTRYLV